jgi:hypothetical protein
MQYLAKSPVASARIVPYITLFEDFIAATSSTPPGWTHTNTNGTLALASGSLLTQTLGGADNDLSQLQMTTATLAIASGKKFTLEWKGKVDKGSTGTIGEQEIYIGLGTVQTGTNFVAADGLSLAVDNFIGFASFDGSTAINAVARTSDVEVLGSAATSYADVTVMVLSLQSDGTTVTFRKDGAIVGTLAASAVPTAALAAVLYVKGGEAKAAVLTTDYVYVSIER